MLDLLRLSILIYFSGSVLFNSSYLHASSNKNNNT